MASGHVQKLVEIARSETDKTLRAKAITYVGASGGAQAADALTGIYSSTQDTEVRASVLRALMAGGSAKQLVEIARKETNPDLKKAAVQYLSHMRSKESTEYLMELLNK
jgi:HEAT repeat protein